MRYMGAYPGVGACPGHYGNMQYSLIEYRYIILDVNYSKGFILVWQAI
jgi:hypothetical protein